MIIVLDVAYTESFAHVAGVVFENWTSQKAAQTYTLKVQEIAEYESGQFYKRELPCLLALLQEVKEPIDLIVIDGYVTLGEDQHYGLGQYLYEALDCKIPVIGVAKNEFKGTPKYCEILRGLSQKPLYVTAIGIDLDVAKNHVENMYGKFRIPELLKEVDRLSRAIP
ncbi:MULTISPECIES: endonuclease V [Acinetobacter]|uniref:Endonuclease V n=1 Tax=Acinetobacter wuhouensis TaxID=1879050 RepID=A0A3G2T217_9GAMM|nr:MULTISPECIES: endonuclease V [Acinetobacter]AYO53857.1 endonuclease V [Acinetobacter wuhouensis]RZG76353.1 endonuclease V [Acinetobacter sp. WCHAc060025]